MRWLVLLAGITASSRPAQAKPDVVDGQGRLARTLREAVAAYDLWRNLRWTSVELDRCPAYLDVVPCVDPCVLSPELAQRWACDVGWFRPPWVGGFPFDGLYRDISTADLADPSWQDVTDERRDRSTAFVALRTRLRRDRSKPALRPVTLSTIRTRYDPAFRYVFHGFAKLEDVPSGRELAAAWQRFADLNTDANCSGDCPIVLRAADPGVSGLLYCHADFVTGVPGALQDACSVVMLQTRSQTWIAAAQHQVLVGGAGGAEDFTCRPRRARSVREHAQLVKDILGRDPFDLRTELKLLGKDAASVLGVRNMQPSRILRFYREKTTVRILIATTDSVPTLSVITAITLSRQNSGSPLDYHNPDDAQQSTYVRALLDALRPDFDCSLESR